MRPKWGLYPLETLFVFHFEQGNMERGLKYDCSLVKKLPEENLSGTPCYCSCQSNNSQALVT